MPPAERRQSRLALGLTAALALLAGALVASFLVQRSAIRENEQALGSVAERLEGIDRSIRGIDGSVGELERRLGVAEERTKGTGALAARVLPSVFSIDTPDGGGAGFAAWREGGATILLTAAHVVSGFDKVTVRRGERSWKGEVVEVDSTNDLATVRVSRPIGRVLWQEPVTTLPRVGATLVLFGSPLGYEGTLTRGVVSRVAYDEIQTDAPANPGSSGGPALTEDGRVVGVVVSGYEGRDINFLVPIRRVCVKLRSC
jgi:S1-C subfamily serine protease